VSLSQLRYLNLRGCSKITDEGLAHLQLLVRMTVFLLRAHSIADTIFLIFRGAFAVSVAAFESKGGKGIRFLRVAACVWMGLY
jgi:hypothetical protein